MTVVLGLLQAAPSPETVGPGFAGFLAIFGVALATVLLLRSMVGHLRKVRYSPDPSAQTQPDAPEPATSSPDTPEDSPTRDP
jgi:hypothetical protein